MTKVKCKEDIQKGMKFEGEFSGLRGVSEIIVVCPQGLSVQEPNGSYVDLSWEEWGQYRRGLRKLR